MSRARTPAWGWGVLGLAILAALILRCLPWQNFHSPDGGFLFYSIDAYDHLRRITLNVHSFPRLANFDSYAAYPQGLGQIWAPGFDYGLALLCRLAGRTQSTIETICFFFSPVAAALSVLAIFFLARAVFQSGLAGAAAALVLALHPAYLAYSLPMNFDHHVVEPLVVMMLFSLPFLERRGRLSPTSMVIAVLAMLLAIQMWRGSTMYWGLFFASALARVVTEDSREGARSYAMVFGGGACVLGIYCLLDPWGGARQLSFAVVSWFHVGLLAAAGLVLLLYALCPNRRSFVRWIGFLLCMALLAGLAGPLAEVGRQVGKGLAFVRGEGDPWLDSNSELRGVFRSRAGLGGAASYLTAFWFLAPAAVWLAFRQWRQGGPAAAPLLIFVVWSPVLLLGGVIRYSHIAGLFASLAAGGLAVRLASARPPWLWGGVALVLLLPGWPHYREAMTVNLPEPMRHGLYGEGGVLRWLREKTPPTSHWLRPVQTPEYGVLARWSMGARIYQVAQRPAVATAFGWEAHGFYQEAAFWAAEEEGLALALARDSRVRYVVAQAVHDLHTDFAVARQGQDRAQLPARAVGQVLRPELTLHARLWGADGSAMRVGERLLPALEAFRLVYESDYRALDREGRESERSYYKIFEVVPGALVTGRTRPGETVVLALDLRSSRQRTFSYLTRAVAGDDGRFAVRVPYATDIRQGESQPLGEYAVYVGKERRGSLAVPELAVAAGDTLSLPEYPDWGTEGTK